MVTLIWAQTLNGVIGFEGKLPWNIKEEMQHFVKSTKHKTVLMGRNTWDSLKLKPLPKRTNIVITSRPMDLTDENLKVDNNLEKWLKDFKNSQEEIIIIGGKKIFDASLNDADKLIISYIYEEYKGDVFAPEFDLNNFDLTDTQKFTEFEVRTYERKK
ncbi:dihydrofolate reductase [Spiroplasma chinense]|uniref:dihydrofolate reductase n=1 Tax=Spiroplasma chinense TaxID=216932 RepID=A0A5B9Y545_9MOLU|nr:dihydrofolate reductase [Spiroplasma chinense]QEH62080.1 dihydrofolate reductase [Spiroplasma chinense]